MLVNAQKSKQNNIEDAVNDVIILIEKEIIVDEYVRKCQELNS